MKVTLDELQTFVVVVESGSITAASEHLGLTVSAASRSLGRLEEKLQTTLLRRTTRRLALTDEGAAFLKHARSILASVVEAEEQVAARRRQPAGRLRVDAATPFMLHVIVPLISGFRARYPQVELELNSNDGITDLLEKRTDVAFRIGQLRDSTLHARPVGSSRLRILASPEYLAEMGNPRQASDLQSHRLLGFSKPETLNQWPINGADGELLHIRPTMSSSSGETLRQLALAGEGIVSLSDFMTGADVESGRLVVLFPQDSLDMRRAINAVYYRNTALASRIACFVDYVIEVISSGDVAL